MSNKRKKEVEVPDTSECYDDMVGYVAPENVTTSVTHLLGVEENQYNSTYATKDIDPNFPEPWQTCLVSFDSKEDYMEFMNILNRKPYPIKKQMIFESEESVGILSFMD